MLLIAVDDEPLALQDIVNTLKEVEKDAKIHGFNTSAKALKFAVQNDIDVAFLDIEIGEMNGLELSKRLKDLCGKTNIIFVTGYSEYSLDAFALYASGYLLKPVTAKAIRMALSNLRNPVKNQKHRGLKVKTFGNFEVFMDGKLLTFPRSKSKELFAYIIYKHGTGCSNKEIAGVLFEDKPYTISLQKQIQTIISIMMKTLKDANADNVIIKNFNNIAVDVSMIDCDYYRFLDWDSCAINEYTGEYMSNYSWAEFTIAYLDSRLGL